MNVFGWLARLIGDPVARFNDGGFVAPEPRESISPGASDFCVGSVPPPLPAAESISPGASDFSGRVLILHGDRVVYDGPAAPLRSRYPRGPFPVAFVEPDAWRYQ